MKRNLFLAVYAALALMSCGREDDGRTVTLKSLLDGMTDMYAPAEYPTLPYEARMVSSHDRRSSDPGDSTWFANDDGFGYERLEIKDGRKEKVLFEETCPGAIMRIWITTRNPRSTLRFYFDGHETPDWVMNSFDFTEFGLNALDDNPLVQIHTSYEKGMKGGQTFYLPIPYSEGCKITLEEPEGWSGIPRYYQIEYRRYPEGTPVETFSVEVAEKYSRDIVAAGKRLASRHEPEGKLSKGGDKLVLPRGSRVVTWLSVNVEGVDSASYARVMRSIVLRGVFDGKETILAPLSDFSGAGMGAFPVDCRQLYSDGRGSVRSYWIMPYRDYALFEAENLSGYDCRITIEARTRRYDFGPNTLYFHTSWHSDTSLVVTDVMSRCKEWDFTEISGGRGIYAGDNLTLFNHSKAWYGEGDEKIYVDGSDFPVFFGTGTEDYYNSSWAPVVIFHTPFGGAPRADLASSRGYNTFLRTRVGDLIPFSRSLDFDLELISWRPGEVDYASTVYWYGDRETEATAVTDPRTFRYDMPDPPPDPEKFVIENSVEAESLVPVYISPGLNTDRQDMSGFPDGMWSGARQLVFYGGSQGDRAVLELGGISPGEYEVGIHATMAADYGIISISLDGRETATMDCYFPSVINSDLISLGRTCTDGNIRIEISIAGKNRASKGTMFGLDCIILKKTNDNNETI